MYHHRSAMTRFFGLGLMIAGVLLGCAMPRHSDTLIFGTNTKIALDISGDPSGRPELTLGYRRQELVWMPLLVNGENSVTVRPGQQTSGTGVGAAASKPGTAPNPGPQPEHSLEGAKYIGKEGLSSDTYSVMASFGAKFSAEGSASVKAGGGLAQYFATGLAARKLAEQGGAALVNTQVAAPRSFTLARDVESSMLEYFVVNDIKVAEIDTCRKKKVGEKVEISDFIQMPDYAKQRAECVQEVFKKEGG